MIIYFLSQRHFNNEKNTGKYGHGFCDCVLSVCKTSVFFFFEKIEILAVDRGCKSANETYYSIGVERTS